MSAVGAVFLVAVLLIVLALVYFLVSTILALRKINAGLDTVIAGVGEIVEKSAPVNEVVTAINGQLDAGVELLEGLLVKKAGMTDAMGLVEGLYPGSAAAGLRAFPESGDVDAAAHRRGLHEGHADAGAARAGGADRGAEPGRRRAAQRRGRQPRGAAAVPERPPPAPGEAARLAGDRHRRPRAVRAPRGHRSASQALADQTVLIARGARLQTPAPFEYERATSVEGAIATLRAARPRGARSSPAATACCR